MFTCVSMLAKAVGAVIARDVRELIDPMLAVGLRSVNAAKLPQIIIGQYVIKSE